MAKQPTAPVSKPFGIPPPIRAVPQTPNSVPPVRVREKYVAPPGVGEQP